jgi:signal transduction histidine kinase
MYIYTYIYIYIYIHIYIHIRTYAKGNIERDPKDEPEYKGPLGDHPLSSIRLSVEDTGIGLSKGKFFNSSYY